MFVNYFCSSFKTKFSTCFLYAICLLTVFFSSVFLHAEQKNSKIPKVGDRIFFEIGDFSSKKYLGKKNLVIVFYRGHF